MYPLLASGHPPPSTLDSPFVSCSDTARPLTSITVTPSESFNSYACPLNSPAVSLNIKSVSAGRHSDGRSYRPTWYGRGMNFVSRPVPGWAEAEPGADTALATSGAREGGAPLACRAASAASCWSYDTCSGCEVASSVGIVLELSNGWKACESWEAEERGIEIATCLAAALNADVWAAALLIFWLRTLLIIDHL
jgi:hypothetical protein